MRKTKERRPREFDCLNCGHEFTARVRHTVLYIEEIGQPTNITLDKLEGLRCPECNSPNIAVRPTS
jgi:DNA-directed RNA polymerase subunit RPC12/RpoP